MFLNKTDMAIKYLKTLSNQERKEFFQKVLEHFCCWCGEEKCNGECQNDE